MTATANRPRRKPGPKPSPYGSKMVRIPGELIETVEKLKSALRQKRKANP